MQVYATPRRGDLKPGFTNHIFCGVAVTVRVAGRQRLAFVRGRIALATTVAGAANHRRHRR